MDKLVQVNYMDGEMICNRVEFNNDVTDGFIAHLLGTDENDDDFVYASMPAYSLISVVAI